MIDEPLPIPHRCGAILGFCILRPGYKILFCDVCKQIVGWEKDGMIFVRTFKEKEYRKKQYSDETLNNSV